MSMMTVGEVARDASREKGATIRPGRVRGWIELGHLAAEKSQPKAGGKAAGRPVYLVDSEVWAANRERCLALVQGVKAGQRKTSTRLLEVTVIRDKRPTREQVERAIAGNVGGVAHFVLGRHGLPPKLVHVVQAGDGYAVMDHPEIVLTEPAERWETWVAVGRDGVPVALK
jgi:hypothetical protein